MERRELWIYFIITFVASFLAISLALAFYPRCVNEPGTIPPSQMTQPTTNDQGTTTPGGTSELPGPGGPSSPSGGPNGPETPSGTR